MSEKEFITAFAPASIGNMAVGFDMLGLAIEGLGDHVSARRIDGDCVTIIEVREPGGEIHPSLSSRADENTASIAAQSLWDATGESGGVELIVQKGIPLQSGVGSSAASAVAAVVALNGLLDSPRDMSTLLHHALVGEEFASGGIHADNVAPSLLGGLVLCPLVILPDFVKLPVPEGISCVVIHPELEVNTAESRKGLAQNYSISQWLAQQGYLASFVAACGNGDMALFKKCLRDELIEPQRAAAVPCFEQVKAAALGADAIGCSLAGSGPSIFALGADHDVPNIADVMSRACRDMGYECEFWISPLDAPGARII